MTMFLRLALHAFCSGLTRTGCPLLAMHRERGICTSVLGDRGSRIEERGTRFTIKRQGWSVVPLSTRAWIAAGLVVGGFLVGWQTQGWRMSGQLESERASHAAYVARQQEASADVISRTLLRERELREAIEENEKNAQDEKERLRRKLADSDAVARRMRERLDDISGRLGADTSAASECDAARAAAGVLADMQLRLDDVAGVYAEYADRIRISANSCVGAYGALTSP